MKFSKKSHGEFFVVQMMGLRGESMNPMTFGNMTHPNDIHCILYCSEYFIFSNLIQIWICFIAETLKKGNLHSECCMCIFAFMKNLIQIINYNQIHGIYAHSI